MSDTLAIEAELKRLGKVAKGMADDLATVLERMHTIAEGPRTMTEIRVYDGNTRIPFTRSWTPFLTDNRLRRLDGVRVLLRPRRGGL